MKIMYLRHSPRGEQEARTEDEVLQKARSYVSPGTELEMHYPDDFPGSAIKGAMSSQGILNGLYHHLEVPSLVRKAVEAERSGFDAVVQGNGFDPAIEASRLAVRIPVIGALKTSLHVASTLADRIGITVPFQGHVPVVRKKVAEYGFADKIVDIRPMGVYTGHPPAEVLEAVVLQAEDLVAQGSELLLPLGGALIPKQVPTETISERVGIPVLDTLATALRYAEFCVHVGLTHSAIAYPHAELTQADFDGMVSQRWILPPPP